jgi:riboflavin kinase/FMN adenylyltransferase
MRILTELNESILFNHPILTLGTYDGVHLGHQEIIRTLVQRAKNAGKESVLFTFEPHPRKVLYPEGAGVKLIDSVEEKIEKLKALGLDTIILFPFSLSFSRLSAMEFVRDILVHSIGVSEVHIGYDHHFGKNREGSFQELIELGELFNFSVHQIGPVTFETNTISSTKIRNALIAGEIDKANSYLGRRFSMRGVVVHGKKLGRTIGFPTANIDLNNSDKIIPKFGVYAVLVRLENVVYKGVMSVGINPTVTSENTTKLEVYIFDFDREIYDQEIEVEFVQYIREEMRFESMELLINQIKDDEQVAIRMLADIGE